MSTDAVQVLEAIAVSIQANWIAIAAALVSLTSATVAATQKRQEMRIGWNRDLINWAKEAMAAISASQFAAQHLASQSPEAAAETLAALKSRLSASVDQGRLFFENIEGSRQRILDPLVCVLVLLNSDLSTYEPQRLTDIIDTHRSNFWHRAQNAVDPRWMRKTVQGIASQAGSGTRDFQHPVRDAA